MGNTSSTTNSSANTSSNSSSTSDTSKTQLSGSQSTTGTTSSTSPSTLAQSYLSAGTNPTYNTVSNYMNPYTNSVTNSTMGELSQLYGKQQNQVVGNAISSGALGGDRQSVAQSYLAGQQDLSAGYTLSNLNSSNYTQAQTAASNANSNNLTAAGMAGTSSTGTGTSSSLSQALSSLLGTSSSSSTGSSTGSSTTTSSPSTLSYIGSGVSALSSLLSAADGGTIRRDTGGTTSSTSTDTSTDSGVSMASLLQALSGQSNKSGSLSSGATGATSSKGSDWGASQMAGTASASQSGASSAVNSANSAANTSSGLTNSSLSSGLSALGYADGGDIDAALDSMSWKWKDNNPQYASADFSSAYNDPVQYPFSTLTKGEKAAAAPPAYQKGDIPALASLSSIYPLSSKHDINYGGGSEPTVSGMPSTYTRDANDFSGAYPSGVAGFLAARMPADAGTRAYGPGARDLSFVPGAQAGPPAYLQPSGNGWEGQQQGVSALANVPQQAAAEEQPRQVPTETYQTPPEALQKMGLQPLAERQVQPQPEVRAAQMTPGGMTPEGEAWLKGQEGYSPKAYGDYKQTSIGYGTKARPGETAISQEEASDRLQQETGKVARWLDENAPGVTGARRDALISFGYNLGTGKGGLNDLLPAINSGDWNAVAGKMERYNHAGGQELPALTSRRAQEADMVRTGELPAGAQQRGVSALGEGQQPQPGGLQAALAAPGQAVEGVGHGLATLGGKTGGFLERLMSGNLTHDDSNRMMQLGALIAAPGERNVTGTIQGIMGEQNRQAQLNRQAQIDAGKLQLEMMQANKPAVVGQDAMGRPQYATFNAQTRSWEPVQVQQPGGGQAQQQASIANVPEDLHGEDFLKAAGVSANDAAAIRNVANYKMALSAFQSNKNPQLVAMATRYNPSFDEKNYQARQRLLTSFTAGKDADEIKSYSAVMHHTASADAAIDQVGNTQSPWINTPYNLIRGQISPQYQAAAAKMENGIDTAIAEYNKATSGKPITVDERQAWRDRLSTSSSPATAHAVYQSFMEYIAGRMSETANKFNSGMGLNPGDPGYKTVEGMLSPAALKEYRKLSGMGEQPGGQQQPQAGGEQPQRQPITATGPNGQKIILRNGQWVPMQ